MKYGILILILVLLMVAAGCAAPREFMMYPTDGAAAPAESAAIAVSFEYHWNSPTNDTYTLTGADAKTAETLLKSCTYDPMEVCKCVPPIIFTMEDGTEYGINLEESYARSWSVVPEGQAPLTEEQVATLKTILTRLAGEETLSTPKKD